MLEVMSQEEKEFLKENIYELYEEVLHNEHTLNKIYHSLLAGNTVFSHNSLEQEGILHPDPSGNAEYQFSYFDQKGPVGHFNRNGLEEVARDIQAYGFIPLEDSPRILS